MDKITMEQATQMMNTICQKICFAIGKTLNLTGGEISTAEYLTPEINEMSRECFIQICDILGIEEVKETEEKS